MSDETMSLTHMDEKGAARMVDVGAKQPSLRRAVAEGSISMQPATLQAIADGAVPKGEVLNTARIAGIMAAKKCGELIPLCHPIYDMCKAIDKGMVIGEIRVVRKTGGTKGK